MLKYITRIDSSTKAQWIETSLTGKQLMVMPLLNKGTAFTQEERIALKLLGKLPFRTETLDEQVSRAKNQYLRYTSNLQKYIYLNNLHDKNEVLYYKLLLENLAETLPLIYTPGVSAAVKAFSHEFRQPRGLYISYPDKDRLDEILDNRTHADISLMAVTDGERILGIGDQGIGGMDIPIAKLVVYSLCGINPYNALPVMLDVGTDNQELLDNPLYLGWRHPRLRGKEYDDFIHSFVEAVHQKFPQCMLHWEDFGLQNARRILETYRTYHCTFNDDMQGTGVVTLAALLAAVQAIKSTMREQRIVVFGAGTAGVGIADQLYNAMLREGMPEKEARRQFWLIDRDGLLQEGMNLTAFQQPYARPSEESIRWEQGKDLLAVVKAIKPTIMIGCSTVRHAFSEEIVKAMASATKHPIIFPLSNPNEKCEADPEDLIKWTEGKALIATGSPYERVEFDGKTYHLTQCNNALSFPGIGIGSVATKASQITDNMLWAAATTISEHSPVRHDLTLPLLPAITDMTTLATHVALSVAKQAIVDGVATVKPSLDFDEFVQDNIWRPYYRPIKYNPNI
ncbi:MAG: NAD-dependent malic enzyme [Proteobacteria bacterium]|nr:NAD-dependent malic enzyme [Pseudomonadota bacterium]